MISVDNVDNFVNSDETGVIIVGKIVENENVTVSN